MSFRAAIKDRPLRSGVKRDSSDGSLVFKYSQDCTPIIENNKRLHNETKKRSFGDLDMKPIASVPMVVIMEWRLKHGVDFFNRNHEPAVRRLLNDPDYMYLRHDHKLIT